MNLIYQNFDFKIEFEENYFYSIVIENQDLFSEMISDIDFQLQGLNGKFVLSENYVPIEVRKNVELITQFIPFNLNRKDLTNKVYDSLVKQSMKEEMTEKTYNLFLTLTQYLQDLMQLYESELEISQAEDIMQILKMFNVRFSEEEKDLCEKLLDYMVAVERYKSKKLFVTVNLRSYISDEKASQFFKELLLRKISILCIESCERKKLPQEKRMIIDKDCCVI